MEVRIPKKRHNIKEKEFDTLSGKTKQIHIPVERPEYEEILFEAKKFRNCIDELISKHPEIFPEVVDEGYSLHDILPESKKLPGVRSRRIKLKGNQEVFTILPYFVLPYMTGYTEEVEKPLFLRQFGVPYWGLTYVFGKNDMYWYRLENHMGRNSIVGTTIKKAENLPEHIIADEKFSKENKERVYIPITVSQDCILGVCISKQADHLNLIQAYSHFKDEAHNIESDYQPKTVTTDGWEPTRWAWKMLFPAIELVLCFFHSFLKIRDCCWLPKSIFRRISDYIWQAYHEKTELFFREKILQLRQWARENITSRKAFIAVNKLCSKVDIFARTYQLIGSYRTTANLDRLMDRQDRFLYSCKYFHGHRISSEYSVRAWAILHNFLPYSPRSKLSFVSPAHRINGFVYHQNWLKNLLVSSSMGGFR